MSGIHLFVPNFRTKECLEEIRICLDKGWTGLGFKTLEMEKAWSEYTGLPHAHFLNSATAGLHLAVRLLKDADGWKDGDEVITSPLTFVSTNHAILYENLKPVFADVDEYLCLSPESVESRLSDRTRAVMFVGMGGNTGSLDRIAQLCRDKNIRLILDAAHMAGTRFEGKHVGAESDAAVFSFQAVKNLPSADSGMICFADQALDRAVRKWTWLGINKDTYTRTHDQSAYKWQYEVEHPGFKYHGNSIMAAMALVGLRYLDQDNARRREICQWYDEALSQHSGIERIPTAPNCESSRHLYQIAVDKRDEVMLAMNEKGVYPGVHYRTNCEYLVYRDYRVECPQATRYSDSLISLPLHLGLSKKDVSHVAKSLMNIVTLQRGLPA